MFYFIITHIKLFIVNEYWRLIAVYNYITKTENTRIISAHDATLLQL